MATSTDFRDLEDAARALKRVETVVDAVKIEDITPMNLDLVSAASIVLGNVERILTYRERMVRLAEFDVSNADNLTDYALAAWYLYVTNLPVADIADYEELLAEVVTLRAKLLMWAGPLVGSGLFEQGAIDKIKEGSGNKDAASDVVALVGLYRSRWDSVKAICGVTEEDLERGALIAPAVFGMISRKENRVAASQSDLTLRVRRAWTVLDRAYAQCQRALEFLVFDREEVARIAPSLRRNSSVRVTVAGSTASPATTPATTPGTPIAAATGASAIGGAGGPFAAQPNSPAR
jgi:hypothetical protein